MKYSNPVLAIKVLSDLQDRLNNKLNKKKYKKNAGERNLKK